MTRDHFVVAYALDQISGVLAYQKAHPQSQIVTLDFWVERALEKQGVSYISSQHGLVADEEAWWALAQTVAREWYRLPSMSFFQHRGIRIAESLEPVMEIYLSQLFHYVRRYAALKSAYPRAQFYIPVPVVSDAPTAASLISFERWAVLDAARVAGLFVTNPVTRGAPPKDHLFSRSLTKTIGVHLFNACMWFVPRPKGTGRTLKVYASEYWSHIGPIVPHLPELELVLMEMNELTHISWRDIFTHRIRIRHPADMMRPGTKRAALRQGAQWQTTWLSVRRDVGAYLESLRNDLDWSAVLEAFDYVIAYAPRVSADTDALFRIMQEEKPDRVLQLASVGGRRHHFFLMAQIARQLGIPSIELQHSGAIFDPRSVFSRLETSVLATYGEVEREEYMRNGYASERLIPVGAPRFDQYLSEVPRYSAARTQTLRSLGLDPARRVVFVTVQAESPSLSPVLFSSYQTAAFFEALQQLQQKMPELQFIFKFRLRGCADHHRSCLTELFERGGMAIATSNPLPLICASDCVLSGNSTVMYEAMLADRPLVLASWKRWDYNLTLYRAIAPSGERSYELAEILRPLFSSPSFAREVREKQHRFMERHMLDGHAAERIALLLRADIGHV